MTDWHGIEDRLLFRKYGRELTRQFRGATILKLLDLSALVASFWAGV